jgi:hypothetical protein
MKNTIYLMIIALTFSACKLDYHRQKLAWINDASIHEISGIVPSVKHQGYFWVINDSGNDPLLYLINQQGQVVSFVEIMHAKNKDWEALAIDTNEDQPYIYIGDIGDNRAARRNIHIYSIPEPAFDDRTAEAAVMSIAYKEGPRDAETLMFDPLEKELVIVTKRERRTHVYQFPFQTGDHQILSKGRINHTYLTGGEISANGDVLLKNYWRIFLWSAQPGRSIVDRMTKSRPKSVKYKKEIQGEAICWSLDGEVFYTVSEMGTARMVPFYEYKK